MKELEYEGDKGDKGYRGKHIDSCEFLSILVILRK